MFFHKIPQIFNIQYVLRRDVNGNHFLVIDLLVILLQTKPIGAAANKFLVSDRWLNESIHCRLYNGRQIEGGARSRLHIVRPFHTSLSNWVTLN
jgi:hypothetical protein